MLPKPPSRRELADLGRLLETGELVPVIDRSFALAELSLAMRYLETGHARGKVVIVMDDDARE